jgi:nanoRNase/pAp phosphatase (c-di-AMP/oligoRNAs hydrolase)
MRHASCVTRNTQYEPKINVSKIAAKFGGGGHKMAAGTHLPGPIEKAKKLIFNAVAEQFKQST